ncbi:MAG: hypothetical protein NTU47_12010 [Ignavibacteriales bacterium]|nr:hypothetical protein [Ignavibacteriales bacterium]
MKNRLSFLRIVFCVAIQFGACNKSNNILLGRVEEKLGSHVIIVTDCFKTSVPPALLLKSASDKPFYRFTPCLDADVVIDGDVLIVNGRSYGAIKQADTVTVDHGKVLVNNIVTPVANAIR